MKNFFLAILNFFKPKQTPIPSPAVSTPTTAPKPVKISVATGQPAPVDIPKDTTPKYLFDTPQNSRHSIRQICDELLPLTHSFKANNGQMYLPKDVITACIEQESGWMNYKNGEPVKRLNLNKDGSLSSTDWGICQINDTPGWHIGKGLYFSSVQDVLDNPDKAIRYMIECMKEGNLKLWVSYSSGAYEKYMPQ